jgi:hypothetical protein
MDVGTESHKAGFEASEEKTKAFSSEDVRVAR